jgi:CheY-like chemotaxis protein
MIRDLGHQVREASGGFEALAILGEGQHFDAIVTDFKMPGMDGAELAANVRKIAPDTPILLITGYTGSDEGVAGLPQLSKPFGQQKIATALAQLLNGGENIIEFPTKNPTKLR